MNTRYLCLLAAPVLLGLGCNKVKEMAEGTTSGSSAPLTTASSVAAPAASDLHADDPGAVCAVGEKKVWGKWANRRTGLTPRTISGRLVIGVAIGNKPHLLSFDKQGNGDFTKVSIPDGSALAHDIPAKEGRRDLQRVTPFAGGGGKLTAFADYRDKYENQHRRVACENVAEKAPILVYDDKPLLDESKKKAEPKKEAPDAGPAVAVAPDGGGVVAKALRAGRLKGLAGHHGSVAAADAGTAAPPVEPAAKTDQPKEPKKKPLREIRDCRSFVDDDGDAWAIGSELYGEPQDDESVKWSMRFFVSPTATGGYYLLDSVPFSKEPKTLYTHEVPAAAELADGTIALAVRYNGTLMSWLLSSQHKPTGRSKSYRGGWPTMVEFDRDDHGLVLLTSLKMADGHFELRYGDVAKGALPGTLSRPTIEGADPSLSEPTIATVGGQRWMAYQAGKRGDGELMLVPVDASFKAVGRSYDAGAKVALSRLFPIDGGKLLSVYIAKGKEGDEIVSQVLSCSVKN